MEGKLSNRPLHFRTHVVHLGDRELSHEIHSMSVAVIKQLEFKQGHNKGLGLFIILVDYCRFLKGLDNLKRRELKGLDLSSKVNPVLFVKGSFSLEQGYIQIELDDQLAVP